MEYENGHAVIAAALNAGARRHNGIRNLDPTHDYNEGPCHVTVGTGQNAIELDIAGGTPQIDGTEITFQSTQVTLPDNPSSPDAAEPEWRQDVIMVSESGDPVVLEGPLAPNRHWTVSEDGDGDPSLQWYYPEGGNMAVPEPPDTHGRAGAILARVTVPPGASTSNDLTDNVKGNPIQDLRFPAIRERLEPWQHPDQVFGPDPLDPGDERGWAMTVRPGEAFELYSLSQNHSLADWDSTWGVETELINSTDGVLASVADTVFSTTSGYLRGDPIERIEVPAGASERDIGFVQRNDGDTEMTAGESVTLSAAYRVYPL